MRARLRRRCLRCHRANRASASRWRQKALHRRRVRALWQTRVVCRSPSHTVCGRASGCNVRVSLEGDFAAFEGLVCWRLLVCVRAYSTWEEPRGMWGVDVAGTPSFDSKYLFVPYTCDEGDNVECMRRSRVSGATKLVHTRSLHDQGFVILCVRVYSGAVGQMDVSGPTSGCRGQRVRQDRCVSAVTECWHRAYIASRWQACRSKRSTPRGSAAAPSSIRAYRARLTTTTT
jgi:hypothetical protein